MNVLLEVSLEPCVYCRRLMVAEAWTKYGSPFAHTLPGQMEKNNWTTRGASIPGTERDEYACVDCVAAGKVKFTCAICEQERTSEFLHEEHYDEAECTICYETISAKIWEEWHDEQSQRKRYHYE